MVVDTLDVSDRVVAAAVLDLQRQAYQVEAELIGSDEIPGLEEPLDDLMSADLSWLAVFDDGRIVAAMAYTTDEDYIDIDRLIVAPDQMRRGCATLLLAELDPDVPTAVSTGTLNGPARRLYEKLGFVEVGTSEPVPGLSVTHYLRGTDD